MLNVSGPAFANTDSSQWCLSLLFRSITHAVIFQSAGEPIEPASVLRKRPILVIRGSFRNPAFLDADLFQYANRQLRAEEIPCEREPVMLLEMSEDDVL